MPTTGLAPLYYPASDSVDQPNDDELLTSATNVSAGHVVYLSASDTVGKADATSITTMPAYGFCVSKPTTTTAVVRRSGQLAGLTLTGDTAYFVSAATAGAITATAPTGAGKVVQGVGRAINATTLGIDIDEDDYTVLA